MEIERFQQRKNKHDDAPKPAKKARIHRKTWACNMHFDADTGLIDAFIDSLIEIATEPSFVSCSDLVAAYFKTLPDDNTSESKKKFFYINFKAKMELKYGTDKTLWKSGTRKNVCGYKGIILH